LEKSDVAFETGTGNKSTGADHAGTDNNKTGITHDPNSPLIIFGFIILPPSVADLEHYPSKKILPSITPQPKQSGHFHRFTATKEARNITSIRKIKTTEKRIDYV
jgi:hypothetical protein